ncbi:MAG: type II toxin-antitoxin system VapC family toxin [Candidatus Limnocylindria bacterium]
MRLLLDAHVVLWWLADDPTLERAARDAIVDGDNWVAVSAATVWEIGIKRALGKLEAPDDLIGASEASHLEPLAITVGHADAAAVLPRHHDDPFDRMLVAQARIEGLTIVTRDPAIARYGVPVLPG